MPDVTSAYVKQHPGAEVITVQLAFQTPKRRVVGGKTGLSYGYFGTGDRFNIIRADYEAQPRKFTVIARQPVSTFHLDSLPGIGAKVASNLQDMGVQSKQALYELGVEGLRKAGMFPRQAQRLYDMLQEELEGDNDAK